MQRAAAALALLLTTAGFPQQAPVYHVERRLVNVTFTVADERGAPRAGLDAADFEVFEDGARREIEAFARERDLPLTLGVLFESKEPTKSFRETSRRLTAQFLRGALRPEDRVFLVAVRPDTRLLLDETGAIEEADAVFADLDRRVQAAPVWRSGWSYKILEDLSLAVDRKLASHSGRKAILLIQAGWDWRSKVKPPELIEKLQRADVVVYHLKIPNTIDKTRYVSPVIGPLDLIFIRRPLARICAETGGAQLDYKDAAESFRRIEEELRSSYTLAFRPGRAAADNGFHRISIRCRRPGLRVRHREGYRDLV